tara:strand:- start:297 stop:998 length:702 start_codon:yes stop_codon:yes gene_type:complete
MAIVLFLYFLNFFVILKYDFSTESAVWGSFGDYFGGILNPILSFVSIVLLIKSLTLQYEANIKLSTDIENKERLEKLRSMENLFFSMIDSQRKLFGAFKITDPINNVVRYEAEAVILIEDNIEHLRQIKNPTSESSAAVFLANIDTSNQIYGLVRAFYIAVKLISERLSDENGFNSEDRKLHFNTLINLTDFANLRIVCMHVQFSNNYNAKYLRSNADFLAALQSTKLSFSLY